MKPDTQARRRLNASRPKRLILGPLISCYPRYANIHPTRREIKGDNCREAQPERKKSHTRTPPAKTVPGGRDELQRDADNRFRFGVGPTTPSKRMVVSPRYQAQNSDGRGTEVDTGFCRVVEKKTCS